MTEETDPPAQAEGGTDAAVPVTDRIVDRWVTECIHNSPVSRDTDGFNHFQTAVADLKRRLAQGAV